MKVRVFVRSANHTEFLFGFLNFEFSFVGLYRSECLCVCARDLRKQLFYEKSYFFFSFFYCIVLLFEFSD